MWAKLMVFGNYGVITMTNHTIINTNFQTAIALEAGINCAVCNQPIIEDNPSTGPFNADGELTFICARHRQNYRQLINLLADYITTERHRFTEKTILTGGVAPDAWFLH